MLAADARACRSGRVARPSLGTRSGPARRRPRRRATRTARPRRCPSPGRREKNAASTSSREKPQVVWVRSLVPKEKNSAASAIWPAVSAARGSSIIVPIRCSSVDARSRSRTSARPARPSSLDQLELLHGATSGIMISGRGSPPALIRSAAASRIARDLHREQARDHDAEPDAAQAEHRVLLVQPVHGLQQPQVVLVRPRPRASASATRTDSSVRSGRNSCSGGSSSRIVTGSPSIASRMPTKSSRCSGSSVGQRLLALLVVVGQDQPLDSAAPLAEEHVLGAAQPDALGAEPAGPGRVLGGVGVGAHPQPARLVGVRHDPVHGRDQVVGLGRVRSSSPSKYSHHRRVHDRHLAEEHLARSCRRWR